MPIPPNSKLTTKWQYSSKRVWQWHKGKHLDPWHWLESPEINCYIFYVFMTRVPKPRHGKRAVLKKNRWVYIKIKTFIFTWIIRSYHSTGSGFLLKGGKKRWVDVTLFKQCLISPLARLTLHCKSFIWSVWFLIWGVVKYWGVS